MKNNYSDHSNICSKCYVDDIFTGFNTHHNTVSFLEYLKSKLPNIKFIMETETDKLLPFLNIFMSNVDNNFTKAHIKDFY